MGLWSFDHTCRLLRLVIVNWPKKLRDGMGTLAQVTYIPEADIIRLTTLEARNAPVRPGTYYFLYLPSSSWRLWEQHPFSAIPMPNYPNPAPSWGSQREKEANTTVQLSPSSEVSAASHIDDGKGVTFLIRPKKGMTARLRNKLLTSSPFSTTLHVLLEGPYGSHPLPNFTASRFSSILLVAGGVGITATLSYLQSAIDSWQCDHGSNRRKQVSLVWISREEEFVKDVLRNELQPMLQFTKTQGQRFSVDIRLFATQKQEQKTPLISPDSSNTSNGSSALSLPSSSQGGEPKYRGADIEKDTAVDMIQPESKADADVPITLARPNVTQVISEFCALGSSASPGSPDETKITATGRTAVFACGPLDLVEEARHAVRRQTRSRVDYFEEVYGW